MSGGSLVGRIASRLVEAARSLAPAVRAEEAYALGRERLIREASLSALAGGHPWTADGFGRGYDERVVEYPWLYRRLVRGAWLLDVGGTLNHPLHLGLALTRCEKLLLLNPFRDQDVRDRTAGVCYVRADVRASALRPESFPIAVCLSTLEHVGCDNSRYGAPAGREADPAGAREAAMRAMRDLVSPGGRLLLTVPFGRLEDHGWFVQLDAEALEAALAAFRPVEREVEYFVHERGWHSTTAENCASARYGEQTRGASAVACAVLHA